jgi:hypothetical protein
MSKKLNINGTWAYRNVELCKRTYFIPHKSAEKRTKTMWLHLIYNSIGGIDLKGRT